MGGDRDAGCKMPCGEHERGVERKAGLGGEGLGGSILLFGEERGTHLSEGGWSGKGGDQRIKRGWRS
jgi:hypothetical protein